MRNWRRKFVPLVALATGALLIGVYDGANVTTETANAWVDVSGGSCVRSASPVAYVDGQACGSLEAAYLVAQPGDLVLVKGGTYPSQTIDTANGLMGASNKVILDEAANEAVAVPTVFVVAPVAGLELQDMQLDFVSVGSSCSGPEASCGVRARNVTLRRVDMKSFAISYVDGVSIIGGDVGPASAANQPYEDHPLIGHNHSATTTWAPRNVLVEGVNFHDVTPDGPNHTECLLVWAGDTITVRGNTFRNCYSTGSVYITELNLPDFASYCTDIVVENNFFYGHDDGSNDYVHFESDCELLLRNNSFSRNAIPYLLVASQGSGQEQPFQVFGNVGLRPQGSINCGSPAASVSFRDNVWLNTFSGGSGQCHSSDTGTSSYPYVDQASDLRLQAGTVATDAGYLASYPASDILGNARYLGTAPDAGAHEKE